MPIYLDTETTGLDPVHDEVLEIAIVDTAGDVLVNSLVRPTKKTSWPEAERIHGITPEMVADAPTLSELMESIKAAVRDQELVIYNAGFDLGFLPGLEPASVECCMLGFAEEYGEWSEYHGNYRWQRLASAARYVFHPDVPNHRALGDALACRAVWRYLNFDTERKRVDALREERVLEDQVELFLRHQEQGRLSRYHLHADFMTKFWDVWWLRRVRFDHWTKERWRPAEDVAEEFAQIFFGRSIAWLKAEDKYETIHRSRSAVPADLWPAGRFPKFQWFRDELEESGHAYIQGGMIHPLFHASELKRIKQEFPLRMKESRPCYTKHDLRKLGYSAAQIESLVPYAEAMNRLSFQWYPLYLKSVVDAIEPARYHVLTRVGGAHEAPQPTPL